MPAGTMTGAVMTYRARAISCSPPGAAVLAAIQLSAGQRGQVRQPDGALQRRARRHVEHLPRALLDASRKADWLTRSARNVQKQLQDAEERGLSKPAQVGEAGVTEQEADRVRVAHNVKPVSPEPLGGEAESLDTLADERTDIESRGRVLGAGRG
jgi:hypothetical protein